MNNKDLQDIQKLLTSVFNDKELIKAGLTGELDLIDLITTTDNQDSPEMQKFMDNYFVSNYSRDE